MCSRFLCNEFSRHYHLLSSSVLGGLTEWWLNPNQQVHLTDLEQLELLQIANYPHYQNFIENHRLFYSEKSTLWYFELGPVCNRTSALHREKNEKEVGTANHHFCFLYYSLILSLIHYTGTGWIYSSIFSTYVPTVFVLTGGIGLLRIVHGITSQRYINGFFSLLNTFIWFLFLSACSGIQSDAPQSYGLLF